MPPVALFIAIVHAAVASAPQHHVTVQVLSKYTPDQIELRSRVARHLVSIQGDELSLNQQPAGRRLEFPFSTWRVRSGDAFDRSYRGALRISAENGSLAILVVAAIDDYVADVVASETLPQTPFEALRAQAIVSRSYVLATRNRHKNADACDLAHCQLFRASHVSPRHHAEARRATLSTKQLVLRLASDHIARAVFHSACGGHTASPHEVFGGNDETGAQAVADIECPPMRWTAAIARDAAAIVGRSLFGVGNGTWEFTYGDAGIVSEVVDRDTGVVVRGDVFARAFDRALDWGVVRSGRFTISPTSSGLELRGTGHGHLVGLCQQGAANLAKRGQSYRQILAHYFPLAEIKPL